jgi:hypothetical protein
MKRIFTLLALVALTLSVLAQSPDLMSYQAVLRDAQNDLITNQAVAVQISIIQGAPNNTPVYSEVHSLNTNDNGLVSLEIGNGVTSDDFSTIDWSSGPYYIKTETDPDGGTNYTITSTTQLLSVPYAKYSDEAGNVFSGIYADLTGAPTNVSTFTNDAGYLTSHLWSQNGNNLYYQGGFVGINTNLPTNVLTCYNESGTSYASFQTAASGTGTMAGFKVGARADSHVFIWNYESTPINFGTDATQRMTISAAGDVGIGIGTPTARLQVVGDTKFGSNGLSFNELQEVTGTTHATNDWISFTLPTGYDQNTTRVLSVEINYLGDRWTGLGMENGPGNDNVSYLIMGTTMYIYYPDLDYFKDRAYRALIMQIAP